MRKSDIPFYKKLKYLISCLIVSAIIISSIVKISEAKLVVADGVMLRETLILTDPIQDLIATSTTVIQKILMSVKSMNLETSQVLEIIDIIKCESQFDQNARNQNVSTTTGKVWSTDIGLWQINDYYHLKSAQTKGFDIYTLEGNLEYGLSLYQKEGNRPWRWSKKCWSKTIVGWI